MRANDIQLAIPNIVYKNTQSNIEALSMPVGSIAFATDTLLFGSKHSSGWKWGIGGGDVKGIVSAFQANLSADHKPTNGTWTKMTGFSVYCNYGSHWSSANNRWTPPAGPCILGANGYWKTTGYTGIRVGVYENGSSLITQVSERDSEWYHSRWCTTLRVADGTDYYELYSYRYNTGEIASWSTMIFGICFEV